MAMETIDEMYLVKVQDHGLFASDDDKPIINGIFKEEWMAKDRIDEIFEKTIWFDPFRHTLTPNGDGHGYHIQSNERPEEWFEIRYDKVSIAICY